MIPVDSDRDMDFIKEKGFARTVSLDAAKRITELFVEGKAPNIYLLHRNAVVGRCIARSGIRSRQDVPDEVKREIAVLPADWVNIFKVSDVVALPWDSTHELFTGVEVSGEKGMSGSEALAKNGVSFVARVTSAFLDGVIDCLKREDIGFGEVEWKDQEEVLNELSQSAGPRKLLSYIDALTKLDSEADENRASWLRKFLQTALLRIQAITAQESAAQQTATFNPLIAVPILIVVRAARASDVAVATIKEFLGNELEYAASEGTDQHRVCIVSERFFIHSTLMASITSCILRRRDEEASVQQRLLPLRESLVQSMKYIGGRLFSNGLSGHLFTALLPDGDDAEEEAGGKRRRNDGDDVAPQPTSPEDRQVLREIWLRFFDKNHFAYSSTSMAGSRILQSLLPRLFASFHGPGDHLFSRDDVIHVSQVILEELVTMAQNPVANYAVQDFVRQLAKAIRNNSPSTCAEYQNLVELYQSLVGRTVSNFGILTRSKFSSPVLERIVEAIVPQPKPGDPPFGGIQEFVLEKYWAAVENDPDAAMHQVGNYVTQRIIVRCGANPSLLTRVRGFARYLDRSTYAKPVLAAIGSLDRFA